MSDEEKALVHLDDHIREYRSMHPMNGERLNYLLQQISGTLYYLEEIRSVVHDNYQQKMEDLINDGNSVSRSKVKADIEFPLMYRLRRKMDGAYDVIGAMRSNISWLKAEKNNSTN